MTQQAAVLATVALVRAVTNVNGAPDYPPEQIPADYFPFAVCYTGTGEHTFGVQGERLYLGEIVVEIHLARRDLPTAVEAAIGFGDTVPAKLMNDVIADVSTLKAAGVDLFAGITQTFGELDWGDLQTLGFRFIMTGVKMRTNL